MASLTLADAASRTAPMAEGKKPKRWAPKAAEKADEAKSASSDDRESKSGFKSRALSRMSGANGSGRHNLYKKG